MSEDVTYTPFEQSVVNMLEETVRHPNMEVRAHRRGPVSAAIGNAADAFERIRESRGISLAPHLQDCFLRFSETALYWRGVEPRSEVAGEFLLPRLTNSLLLGRPEWIQGGTAEEEELYSEFRVIDQQPRSGTGTCTVLRIQPAVESPEVWFYDTNRGAFPLDVDYCGYLHALIRTRGLHGWQYLFADVSFTQRGFTRLGQDLRQRMDYVSAAFPGVDYADLNERFWRRMNASG